MQCFQSFVEFNLLICLMIIYFICKIGRFMPKSDFFSMSDYALVSPILTAAKISTWTTDVLSLVCLLFSPPTHSSSNVVPLIIEPCMFTAACTFHWPNVTLTLVSLIRITNLTCANKTKSILAPIFLFLCV